MNIIITCPKCGKEFEADATKNVFCMSCGTQVVKEKGGMETFTCQKCGKVFEADSSKNVFCMGCGTQIKQVVEPQYSVLAPQNMAPVYVAPSSMAAPIAKKSKGKIIAIILVIILVIGGVGGGLWWYFGNRYNGPDVGEYEASYMGVVTYTLKINQDYTYSLNMGDTVLTGKFEIEDDKITLFLAGGYATGYTGTWTSDKINLTIATIQLNFTKKGSTTTPSGPYVGPEAGRYECNYMGILMYSITIKNDYTHQMNIGAVYNGTFEIDGNRIVMYMVGGYTGYEGTWTSDTITLNIGMPLVFTKVS